jgi:hypothetical protein
VAPIVTAFTTVPGEVKAVEKKGEPGGDGERAGK